MKMKCPFSSLLMVLCLSAIAAPVFAQNAEVMNDSGLAQMQRKDYTRALFSFNQSISINKKFEPAYVNMGDLKACIGDSGSAIEMYTRAIKLKPEDAAAYCGRGAAWQKDKGLKNALKDLDQAIDIDPKYT